MTNRLLSVIATVAVLLLASRPVAADPCDEEPCNNGGTCVSYGTFYKCLCTPEWAGPRNCNLFPNPCNADVGGYCANSTGCTTGPNASGGTGDSGGRINCCMNGGVCTVVCGALGCASDITCNCPNYWAGPECCVCPFGSCGSNCEYTGCDQCPDTCTPVGVPIYNTSEALKYGTRFNSPGFKPLPSSV